MTDTTEDRASALRSSLDDAAKLIGSQRQTISELREALKWCVYNNGECLGDHPARLRAYCALLIQAKAE